MLLNLALAALIAAGAWRLREEWKEREARRLAVLGAKIALAAQPPAVPPPATTSVRAASYFDIAQKMLFAKDRNPQVIVEVKTPEPEKPLPPLPAVHGVMNIGDGPLVMMSDKPGGRQRGIHPGDKIGEYKLVSITSDEVELSWENRTVKKRLAEMIDRAGEKTAQAGGPSQQSVSTSTPPQPATPGKPEPGVKIAEGMSACQPGDDSPAGAVVNGMKKVVTQTPFGPQCRWEAVK